MMTPQDRQTEIGDLVLTLSRMFRGEVELARAEVRQNLRGMAMGAVMLVVALVLALVALNLLAEALVLAAILAGVSAPWAPVLVAAVLLIVAAVLAKIAISALRPSRLVPLRAAARMRRDAETLKEMMRHDSQT